MLSEGCVKKIFGRNFGFNGRNLIAKPASFIGACMYRKHDKVNFLQKCWKLGKLLREISKIIAGTVNNKIQIVALKPIFLQDMLMKLINIFWILL